MSTWVIGTSECRLRHPDVMLLGGESKTVKALQVPWTCFTYRGCAHCCSDRWLNLQQRLSGLQSLWTSSYRDSKWYVAYNRTLRCIVKQTFKCCLNCVLYIKPRAISVCSNTSIQPLADPHAGPGSAANEAPSRPHATGTLTLWHASHLIQRLYPAASAGLLLNLPGIEEDDGMIHI